MRLNLQQATKEPGQPFAFDCSSTFGVVEFQGDSLEFVKPVRVHGQAVGQKDCVLVSGRASAVVRMPCNRCLRPFDQPLEVDFEEEYTTKVSADHPDRYPIEGEKTDLTPMVLANFLLNMPMKNLCRPDCDGLCPVCGKDLSEGPCGCERSADAQTDNPLQALSVLLDKKEV